MKPDVSHLKRSGRYIPPPPRQHPGLEKRLVKPFAAFLENVGLFRILEKLSFLVAILVFLIEVGDRREKSIYEAWQVVKDGQGEKSGVVILALERLKKEKFSLSGINVKDTNLSDAQLGGADLSAANLVRANLVRADLSSANLVRADLSATDLRAADLSSAILVRADLNATDLRGTNLRGANLRGANLQEADLKGVDLTEALVTPNQLKSAENWELTIDDTYSRKKLGLPPETPGGSGSSKGTP